MFRGYYRNHEVAVKAARRDPNDDPEETKNKEICQKDWIFILQEILH